MKECHGGGVTTDNPARTPPATGGRVRALVGSNLVACLRLQTFVCRAVCGAYALRRAVWVMAHRGGWERGLRTSL